MRRGRIRLDARDAGAALGLRSTARGDPFMSDVRCKVRLADGSVMGPMDGPTLRTWYDQGLVDDETPVLAPGSRNWAPLASVIDTTPWKQDAAGARRPAGSARVSRRDDDEDEDDDRVAAPPGRWRTIVASLLLLAAAAAAGMLALRPERWTPRLPGAPWMEIALGLLALGLLLLRGWNWGRMLVRVAAVLGAVAALALMGPVMAQGADKVALLILACVWILTFALSVFLSPTLSTPASIMSLLVILAAIAGVGYLGYVPPSGSNQPSAISTQ
jgi:hypothetical protein